MDLATLDVSEQDVLHRLIEDVKAHVIQSETLVLGTQMLIPTDASPQNSMLTLLECLKTPSIVGVSDMSSNGMAFAVASTGKQVKIVLCKTDAGVLSAFLVNIIHVCELLQGLPCTSLELQQAYPFMVVLLLSRWAVFSRSDAVKLFGEFLVLDCCIDKTSIPAQLRCSSSVQVFASPTPRKSSASYASLLPMGFTLTFLDMFVDIPYLGDDVDAFFALHAMTPTNIEMLEKRLSFQSKWMLGTGRLKDAAHVSFLREDLLSNGINSEIAKVLQERYRQESDPSSANLKEILRIRSTLAKDHRVVEATNGSQCFASTGFKGWARKLWASLVECLEASPNLTKFRTANEKDANMFVSCVAWALEHRGHAPCEWLVSRMLQMAYQQLKPGDSKPVSFLMNLSAVPFQQLGLLGTSQSQGCPIANHHNVLRDMDAQRIEQALDLWLSYSHARRKDSLCRSFELDFVDDVLFFFGLDSSDVDKSRSESVQRQADAAMQALGDNGNEFRRMVEQARASVPALDAHVVKFTCMVMERLMMCLGSSVDESNVLTNIYPSDLSILAEQIHQARLKSPSLRSAEGRAKNLRHASSLQVAERFSLLNSALKRCGCAKNLCGMLDRKGRYQFTAIAAANLEVGLKRMAKPSYAPKTLGQAACTLWLLHFVIELVAK